MLTEDGDSIFKLLRRVSHPEISRSIQNGWVFKMVVVLTGCAIAVITLLILIILMKNIHCLNRAKLPGGFLNKHNADMLQEHSLGNVQAEKVKGLFICIPMLAVCQHSVTILRLRCHQSCSKAIMQHQLT